jgi:branched-chain amino acid transport system substrate-binding protein
MLDSKALTKIHSIILIAIIVIVTVGGAVYFWFSTPEQSSDTIKIGICADIDMSRGPEMLNGAILAAEEINAEGGVLGRQIEIIAEDSDIEADQLDPSKAALALTRLITYHKVDFVIVGGGEDFVIETVAEHKKIVFGSLSPSDFLAQRVIDDYDKYKYFFRLGVNQTTFNTLLVDSIEALREITGFNKVAYIGLDVPQVRGMAENLDYYLPEVHDFDLVYRGLYPWGTIDFSSYFAAAEAAGAEIMVPLMVNQEGLLLVKEWYDRQSPMVVWGMNVYSSLDSGWNATEGKVEHTTGSASSALQLGYPATTKTLVSQEALFERWGTLPTLQGVSTYDTVRFIIPDAIERAGTIETEAVIGALEETDVETSFETNFRFTSSHDHYFSSASTTAITMMFQWQEKGTKAIVYPKNIMEETGATYTFPDWPGPWDNIS